MPATVPLSAAVPVAANDVWVLGGWVEEGKGIERQFFHFDGSTWQFVPSPQPKYSAIGAAAAVSTNDIWAVGLCGRLRPARHSWDDIPLVEHWDGTQWTILPTPIPPGINSGLASVAVRGPDDVWAVGFNDTGVALKNAGTRYEALVMHWDGTRWSIVTAPAIGDPESDYRQTVLRQVTVTPDGDVIAAGSWTPGDPKKPSESRPLLVRWSGNGWEQLDTRPLVQQRQRKFSCIAAVGNGDLLAGGEPGVYAPFVDSLSGGRWSIADVTALGLASAPQSHADVVALVATSAGDAWAVVQGGETQPDLNMPAILHWDGTPWRTVPPAPYEAQQ